MLHHQTTFKGGLHRVADSVSKQMNALDPSSSLGNEFHSECHSD